jgi:hypothetical protein
VERRPTTFVLNALSPAKVSRVQIVDEEQRIMEVVVEDKQLSLAIGKKGQNVRLAAKIVGWRIDIKSEEEKRREVEAEMARMARAVDEIRSLEAHGVADKVVQKLVEAGIHGLAHLAEMSDEDLGGLEGVGPKTVEDDPRGGGARAEGLGRARRGGGREVRGRAGCRGAGGGPPSRLRRTRPRQTRRG